MSLIGLIVMLLLVGLALYLVGLVPIDARIKQAIYAIIIVFVVIWLLQALGLLVNFPSMRVR